ncbi:ABC transporter ATP-binding protein [Planctomyces sp. SH-PL14]|uniref:ABC transporter ATP-binding protein n=1 Tax=Planctomyces sp. SH-PL14 TaxID=1632864 RepID=UPI00078B27F8|nr:ABC transporter ATP-binding protein [Planctomyces sp. SH-PL14]AMV16761.1 Teichoic acids export ATP-binding protein TagH [Planctomyces sp. SH-PL14]
MPKAAITVEHLSKAYRIGRKEETHNTLTGAMLSFARAPLRNFRQLRTLDAASAPEEEVVWSLRDVSFEIQPGEVVGIIGRNGAGKSTLLKILSRITAPTSGRAVIRGRVSSLLEVGTGFHPELSGRENVYMNGTILGMRKREIDRKFDEIIDFSGVEKFIDTPVKRYSSGMKVRLAFAVAAHLEPEILIIDEVLAVGDFEFQKKCLGKMNDVATSGRTVLFVSHNMAAVESLCSTGLLMEQGRLTYRGRTPEALQRYQRAAQSSQASHNDLTGHPGRPSHVTSIMRHVTLRGDDGEPTTTFRMGGELSVDVAFENDSRFSPVLGIVVKTEIGSPLFGIDNRVVSGFDLGETAGGGRIVCTLAGLPLMPGNYSLDLYLGDRHRGLDQIYDAIAFSVVPSDVFGTGKLPSPHCGPIWQSAEWSLAPQEPALEREVC